MKTMPVAPIDALAIFPEFVKTTLLMTATDVNIDRIRLTKPTAIDVQKKRLRVMRPEKLNKVSNMPILLPPNKSQFEV